MTAWALYVIPVLFLFLRPAAAPKAAEPVS
jgi:hypothetical protein